MLTTDHGGTVAEKGVGPAEAVTLARAPHSPEALIEEARQHQRRRRMWFVAIVLAVVSAVVFGLVLSGGTGVRKPLAAGSGNPLGGSIIGASTARKNTVDLAATPKGWVPVDSGNAQVSVPSSWVITMTGCPVLSQNTVIVRALTPSSSGCSGGSFSADIGPASSPVGGAVIVINGVKVYKVNGVWVVPSLGVDLRLNGPLSSRVLETLTYSPRAVVFARGPLRLSPRPGDGSSSAA